jgi:hypothetical protein
MPQTRPVRLCLGLAPLLLVAAAGCSFSHSSESFSDSSTSSSESSAASSKGDRSAFGDDVVEYTEAFVETGGGTASFLGGVGDLASKRGITDWEADPHAWESIGRGLGRTETGDAQIAAYEAAWTDGDRARMAAIQKGVDAVR